MIWFTSDSHLGHANVLIHDGRPFHAPDCSCTQESEDVRGHGCQACADVMDAALIDNWNSVVGPKDDVWNLGDFCYRSQKPAEWYLKQLKGKIHIIFGNHDMKGGAKAIASKFASFYGSLTHGPAYSCNVELKFDHQLIVMSHYSMRSWLKSHRGAWHLFGHSHGGLPPLGKSYDVGVNTNGYRPVSFDEVSERMRTLEALPHHGEAE